MYMVRWSGFQMVCDASDSRCRPPARGPKGCAIRWYRASAVQPCQQISFSFRALSGPPRPGEASRTILEKNPVKLEENWSGENSGESGKFFCFVTEVMCVLLVCVSVLHLIVEKADYLQNGFFHFHFSISVC